MKTLTLPFMFLVSGLLMSCANAQSGAIAETHDASKNSQPPSISQVIQPDTQNMDQVGTGGLRAEEADGSLLPPALPTMPLTNMSTEGLQEVPDDGGGTMVNIEGRFQSILQVEEGSDKAIHVDSHDK